MTDRFDASRIAFHSLSRKIGRPWVDAYVERTRARARTEPAARRALPALAGARALNVRVGPYGEGRENRGLLAWSGSSPPGRRLEASPDEHRGWVLDLAGRLGAAAAGVAALDRRWVYGRVQLNPYAAGEPACKAIAFGPVAAPAETDDALVIPEAVNRAVVVLVAMDAARLRSDRPLDASVETNLGYSRMATAVVSLADAIRAAGYVAIPCMNDTALSVPLAAAAGLGRPGRHGMLIADGLGSAVRVAKVLTDLPAAPDRPRPDEPPAFCDTCGVCASACPAGAIPAADRGEAQPGPCNRAEGNPWPVDAEACLAWWVEQGESCGRCAGVCPLS